MRSVEDGCQRRWLLSWVMHENISQAQARRIALGAQELGRLPWLLAFFLRSRFWRARFDMRPSSHVEGTGLVRRVELPYRRAPLDVSVFQGGQDRLRHVLRSDLRAQKRSRAVELLQSFRRDPGCAGAERTASLTPATTRV